MSDADAPSSDDKRKKGALPIPRCLTDVTTDWVAELLYKVLDVPEPDDKANTHNGITLLQVRIEDRAGHSMKRRTILGSRSTCASTVDT